MDTNKIEDRLKRARIAIMKHPKFCAFSGVLSCGSMTLDASINPPTACTDGWSHKFHPDFVNTLNEPQLRLLMLHEAVHAAYRHLRVWRHLWKEDRKRTNIAADHFVNLALILMDAKEGFIEMPKVGVQPNMKYKGWSVEQIYRDLMQQQEQSGGDGEGEDEGEGGFDEHDFDGASDASDDLENARAQEMSRALRQGEMLARRRRGKGAGGTDALIEDLLAPKVDWREQLREFVREICQGRDESTWSRPNRRYIGAGMYMPGMYSEKMGDLVVGFDTSGSCFEKGTVTRFVSELKAAVEAVCPERIRVICWDWGIRTDQSFEGVNFDVPELKIRGGGGTDGGSLFRHLKSEPGYRPQAVINFTDGEVGDWGSYDVPTLWVITTRGIRAPWGQSIHMEV